MPPPKNEHSPFDLLDCTTYDKCPTGYSSVSCTIDVFSYPFCASKSAQQTCVYTNTDVHTCLIIHTIIIQTDQTELHFHEQRAD